MPAAATAVATVADAASGAVLYSLANTLFLA